MKTLNSNGGSVAYRLLWLMALFALIGCLLATWLSPRFIIWYWNPPADMGFNCVKPIQWSLRRLQIAQIVGLVVGAVLGFLIFFAFRRRKPALPASNTEA